MHSTLAHTHTHTHSTAQHKDNTHLEQVPEQRVARVLAADEHERLPALVPLAQQLQQAQEALLGRTDLRRARVCL